MECSENEGKCFTFLWKLENISYSLQKKGQPIKSPAFIVDEAEESNWELHLYPRGFDDRDYIGIFLHRAPSLTQEEDKEGIKFEVAFIAKDGSALGPLNAGNLVFEKHGHGWNSFQKKEDVFLYRRSDFLPEDTLTVRCRIWKSVGEMTENVQCTAVTHIGVERRSFLWNVRDFSTLESEGKCRYEMNSLAIGSPVMTIDMSLTGGSSFEETIQFQTFFPDKTVKFCSLQLFLIDVAGIRVGCNHNEFWFNNGNRSKQFTFFLTKKKLLEKKSIYLPNDVLSLHWNVIFSQGVEFERIVEAQCGLINSVSPNVEKINEGKQALLLQSLSNNLKSLYDRQFLCDVKLKTSTNEFPAHKIILSASSPIFNAMFSNDMKEKESDCISIEDLSDDAVNRMLLYIYTSRVEGLTWESASDLYVTADKYGLLSLKGICSSYLKGNLSPSNACELLQLADLCADSELKFAMHYYVLKHKEDIINSDKWKLLVEANGKLAAETISPIQIKF